MSFNFGASGGGSGTGGFSFNQPPTSSSGTTGFSFASPTSTASGGTGGFAFLPQTSVQSTTGSGGFNFGRSAVGAATTIPATLETAAFGISNPSTSTSQITSLGAATMTPVATSTATLAPGTGFSFGIPIAAATANSGTGTGSGGLNFNMSGSASNTGTTVASGTGFSFSTPATAGTTATTTTSSLFNFTAPTPLTGLTPTTTTMTTASQGISATTSSSAGMPSLFAPPASQAQTSIGPTSILGQAIAKAPSASNVTTSSTPALIVPSTSLLGSSPVTSSVALTEAAVSAAPLTTLSTATSTSSSSASATAPGVAAAPSLSVRGLEEKVNKWVSELREQEERLMRQAAHVNAWDQLLQQGHDQVQQLRDTLTKVKVDQQRLQAELDFIQGQQQELEQLIEPLESAVASTTPAQHQGDHQRENMHHLAQSLDAQLHQMTEDLCKVIEHLNSTNSSSQASDPVNTVARVLSAHMDTLKWVDQNCALLTQKIDDMSRTAESKRRD